MTNVLLTLKDPPLPVGEVTDPLVASTPGPAVLFSSPSSADILGPEAGAAGVAADTVPSDTGAARPDAPTENRRPPNVSILLASRPLAYRETDSDWRELGYEASDHWEGLSPELRDRLIADRTSQLSITEYSTTTNGSSASMVTNNWVHSGSPRMYRIAGELRELAEVLTEILDD